METAQQQIGKLYNCNEVAGILGISTQTLLRTQKR